MPMSGSMAGLLAGSLAGGGILPPQAILGASLLGEWYAETGYTVGGTWLNQVPGGPFLNSNSSPALQAAAINGYPAVIYTDFNRWHGRGQANFPGWGVGTFPTVIGLIKRDATANPRGLFTGLSSLSANIRGGTISAAAALQCADWQQGKQSTLEGYVDGRSDRFHLLELSGNLEVWWDGQKIAEADPTYTGLNTAIGPFFGADFVASKGAQAQSAFWHAIVGTPSVVQRQQLRAWCDWKYATTFTSASKWLAHAGQSNTPGIPTNRPRSSRFKSRFASGASLVAGAADWGPTDPHGWRAELYADWLLNQPYKRSAMLWVQGENEVAAGTSTAAYLAGLEEFYAWFASRIAGFIMIVARIPSWNASGTAQAKADIQAAEDQFVANHPTTTAIVNGDDLTHNVDNVHYDTPGSQALSDRGAAAIETLTGDTDWVG